MNKYFGGTPLVPEMVIEDQNALGYKPSFLFREEEWKLDFADKQFTYVDMRNNAHEKAGLVVYLNAQWDDERLITYHNEHYPGVDYWTQQLLGIRTIQLNKVLDGKLEYITITHYYDNWDDAIEQHYDKNWNLYQYNKITSDSEGSFAAESVYGGSTGVIYHENYRKTD